MPLYGDQTIHILRLSDGQEAYTGICQRDILAYPPTTAGQAAFEAAVKLGNHGGIELDNGATIPDGTVPPLVKPLNPTAAPYYEQTVNGDGRYLRPATDTPAVSITYGFTAAPITATNYTLVLIIQTNTGSPGHGRFKVNDGSYVTFATEVADGGTRTLTFTIAFQAGANTILLEHVDGIWIQPRSLTVTRAATT